MANDCGIPCNNSIRKRDQQANAIFERVYQTIGNMFSTFKIGDINDLFELFTNIRCVLPKKVSCYFIKTVSNDYKVII